MAINKPPKSMVDGLETILTAQDTAIATKLTKASNLSDLVDPIAARGNLKIWTGTQATYDAIVTKDAQTIYFIT